MEKVKHEIWWPLHLRQAQGKPLNAEEQAIYEAGLHELYAEEPLDGSIAALRHSSPIATPLSTSELAPQCYSPHLYIVDREGKLRELFKHGNTRSMPLRPYSLLRRSPQ